MAALVRYSEQPRFFALVPDRLLPPAPARAAEYRVLFPEKKVAQGFDRGVVSRRVCHFGQCAFCQRRSPV